MTAAAPELIQNRARTIARALEADPRLAGAEIHVLDYEGTIVLAGSVGCYATKLAAEAAVRHVFGVRDVRNDLDVVVDGFYGVRNFELTHEALHALRWHRLFGRKRTFVVSSRDHVVRIEGEVETLLERLEAERAISNLPDLRGIDNEIVVRCQKRDPDIVKREVESALTRTLGYSAERIAVSATDRTLTLSGTVTSWAEREAALEAVSAIRGIAEIDDRLRFEPA